MYSQTWLQSHCLQHQPLYNNTHGRNGFNGLCTKCPGYNNNLVITAHFSGTKGVVVNKFDCTCLCECLLYYYVQKYVCVHAFMFVCGSCSKMTCMFVLAIADLARM